MTFHKGRDSELSFKIISVHGVAAAAHVWGWGGHSLLGQSGEVAKTSISAQDAAWFGWLGKRKSCCWLLDSRRKQLCVADCLLGEVPCDWQLLSCSFILLVNCTWGCTGGCCITDHDFSKAFQKKNESKWCYFQPEHQASSQYLNENPWTKRQVLQEVVEVTQ